MVDLAPGQKYLIDYGPDNPNTLVIHIRAILDDGMIVFKAWQKHKRRWQYEVENLYYFKLLYEQGRLTRP